jgi:hypothetical protein
MSLKKILQYMLSSFCFVVVPAVSQDSPTSGIEQPRAAFNRIESVLSGGSLEGLTDLLGPTVSIRLLVEEPGIVSGNHARVLLEHFLRVRRPASFVLTRISESQGQPFALGRLTWTQRGARTSAQVYISLRASARRWIIGQLNIY